jgi:hypothetical protein
MTRRTSRHYSERLRISGFLNHPLSNNQNTTKAIAIKTHVPMTRSGVKPGFIEETVS